MAPRKQISESMRAALSRAVDDAVNGRKFAPPANIEEGRAYAERYADYFGDEAAKARAYILNPAEGWLERAREARPAGEYRQQELFEGATMGENKWPST